METAGEEGGQGAAAVGKGCPSNHAGLHSGNEPNSKMQNDRLQGLPWAQRNQRNWGMARRKGGVGWDGGPGCQLQPSTFQRRKIKEEKSRLNLLACVNRENTHLTGAPLWRWREAGAPLFTSLMKQYARREGRNPKPCNFMGALNSSCCLSFIHTDDKDHLLPIYWKLFFFSQLELLKCRELPLPQIAVRHLLNGPGSIMLLPQVQLTLWPCMASCYSYVLLPLCGNGLWHLARKHY